MKEHPIIFSPPMVRAILEGRKTQTRRLVKERVSGPNPPNTLDFHDDNDKWVGALKADGREGNALALCPHGQAGDRLWVRESMRFDADQGWRYEADGANVVDDNFGYSKTFCPSIHMPRAASRINLDISSVRCERLQAISAKDIISEGAVLRAHDDQFGHNPVSAFDGCVYLDLQSLWASGWDKLNAKRAPWKSNPWIWVITFKRICEAMEVQQPSLIEA